MLLDLVLRSDGIMDAQSSSEYETVKIYSIGSYRSVIHHRRMNFLQRLHINWDEIVLFYLLCCYLIFMLPSINSI